MDTCGEAITEQDDGTGAQWTMGESGGRSRTSSAGKKNYRQVTVDTDANIWRSVHIL